jgi:hypothetical protein
VVEAYERYLDAWLLAPLRVSFGPDAVELEVPADGRRHAVEAPLSVPAGWRGALLLETRGYSADVARLTVAPPPRAGLVEALEPRELLAAPATVTASDPTSSASFPDVDLPLGGARVRLELTLYKALPAELWELVERSYRNRLDSARAGAAARRSRVGGCLEAGTTFAD